MSTEIMLDHLQTHYGTTTENALLNHLQEDHAISDLCQTLQDIHPSDLMRAYNSTFEK